jgi:predicted dehydrogenase
MTASQPVRLGIVGVGAWARSNHLPAVQAHAGAQVVAACDLDQAALAAAERDFGVPMVTTDLDELLAQDLDALIVSTPNEHHHRPALAGLQAGLHVLVEKPMALRAQQAWQLSAEAERRGRHVMVPLGWNFTAMTAAARELMLAGSVGELELVSVHMASPMREAMLAAWRAWPGGAVAPASQGYAFAQLPHALGVALRLTGLRAEQVMADQRASALGPELSAALTVRFAGGAVGAVSGTAFCGPPEAYHLEVRVHGSRGLLIWDAEVGRERVLLHNRAGRQERTFPLGSGAYDGRPPVRRFIDLVRGEPVTNEAPAELSARVSELLEAAARSIGTGAPARVELP